MTTDSRSENLAISTADWGEINHKAVEHGASLVQVVSQPWMLDSYRPMNPFAWPSRTAYLVTFWTSNEGVLDRANVHRLLYVTNPTSNDVGEWVALPERQVVETL